MGTQSRATFSTYLPCFRTLYLGFALGLLAPTGNAQTAADVQAQLTEKLKVLDLFRGAWDVTITTHQPTKSVVTSVSKNSWVLGDRYLQGDSGLKSDGAHDLSMMTYDLSTGAYALWIFFSTVVVFFLPSGHWDDATRTMVWKSPPNLVGSYQYSCVLPDNRMHRCTSIGKDWKGKVLLEQDIVAVRRAP